MSYPEAPDYTGKAPKHRDAAKRTQAKEANNIPMVRKDFDYFMKKWNMTPKSDKRVREQGKVRRTGRDRKIIINSQSDLVKWHEIGHIVAEEITKKEVGVSHGGALLKQEMWWNSPFYDSLMAFKITDEEQNTLLKSFENRDFLNEKMQIENDLNKAKNRAPPFDKIPETEAPRIIKDIQTQLTGFKEYLAFTAKPQEVFANYFAVLQTNRADAISRLPRLYARWGDIIDNYMRGA